MALAAALAVPSLSFGHVGNNDHDHEIRDALVAIQADIASIEVNSGNTATCSLNTELLMVTSNLLLSVGLGCWVTLQLYRVARRG